VPRHCKQLTDWAVPCSDDSNNAPNTTHADNDNDTISINSTFPEPHSSEWTNKIADGNILWNSRSSSAPPKDNPRNESTTIVQDNDNDTIPFDSTLPEPHYFKWTNMIVDGNISWNSRLSSAPPKDKPHNESTTIVQRKAPPSSLTAQGFAISKTITQNAHGLRCCPQDPDGNIRPHDPHDYTRYEHLITTMKLKHLDVYFVQETWLKGDLFDEIINWYHIFCHNHGLGSHNFHGVVINLLPHYHKGWKAAGAQSPITTNTTGEFAGWFISINIILASNNQIGKQVQGNHGKKQLALTLASAYHLCTKTGNDKTYLRFHDALNVLLKQLPEKLEIIMGTDINSNIGTLDDLHSTEFCSALGPHSLPKCNKKARISSKFIFRIICASWTHSTRLEPTVQGTAPGPAIGQPDQG
jgi:hypothetical protein